jgi:hypothetical protein
MRAVVMIATTPRLQANENEEQDEEAEEVHYRRVRPSGVQIVPRSGGHGHAIG